MQVYIFMFYAHIDAFFILMMGARYTKTINVTIHIPNMNTSAFTSSYRASLMSIIAQAAGVPVSQVQIISFSPTSGSTRRRRTLFANDNRQVLYVNLKVDGTNYFHQHPLLEHMLYLKWSHAHQVHVRRQLSSS